MTLKLQATWNLDPFPATDQQSIGYALVDISEDKDPSVDGQAPAEPTFGGGPSPLNLSLVLDTSGSMGGPKLQNLKQAVKWVVNHLGPQDTISITLFDEEVHPLVGSTRVAGAISGGVLDRVDAIREANGTAMSKGLLVGLDEAMKGREPGSVSRIIVLTDGQTWGDADRCRELASQAGHEGIPITALGVGADEDWSIELLDDMTTASGGLSGYIAKPQEIADAFRGTVLAMQQTVARNVRLTIHPSSGLAVRAVYRVAPIISKLWPPESGQPQAQAAGQTEVSLPLGDMEAGNGQSILLEWLLPPRKPGQYRLARLLLRSEATGRLGSEETANLDLVANFEPGARRGPGNPRVMNSVEKATTFKLQTRALQASMVGDVANATRNLRAAATRLLNLGETGLAQATEEQAQLLEAGGQMSAAGTKKLAFETRKLAVSETENTKASTLRFNDDAEATHNDQPEQPDQQHPRQEQINPI